MKKLSTLSLASDGEIKKSMLYQKKGKGGRLFMVSDCTVFGV